MTDTTTLAPTDAELFDFCSARIADDESVRTGDTRDHVDFARAVLARWGDPAHACGEVRTAAQALIDRWDTPNWKDAEHTGAFIQRLRETLAAPQEPEVRVPLSIEEVEAILARWDYAIHGDRVRYIVRETERAHGITSKEPIP